MKKIPLTQGKFAIVDDADFEWLNQHKWHYLKVGYAARREQPSDKYVYMHRVINQTPKGFETDHINRNRLDNQRGNLRDATRSQNSFNQGLSPRNTTGHKGVRYLKEKMRWTASIQIKSKQIHLGTHTNLRSAIKARKQAEEYYYGN